MTDRQTERKRDMCRECNLDAVFIDVSRTGQVVSAFINLFTEDDDLFKEEDSSFFQHRLVLPHRRPTASH